MPGLADETLTEIRDGKKKNLVFDTKKKRLSFISSV